MITPQEKAMKKHRIISAVLSLAIALATMFALTACAPEIIEGDGGVTPEGYYEVEIDGSTFCLPSDFKKQSWSNGIPIYTFDNGNFNTVTTPIKIKAEDYTKKLMKNQYVLASSMSGIDMSVEIDEFKMYKLSGLIIVYIANTTTYNSTGQACKQYQFIYDTPTSQVSLTLTFDAVADGEASDIPENILHSISIND